MTNPTIVLLVRFRSRLSTEDAMRVVEERAPDFQALEGLSQKYYLTTDEPGEYGGLYLWEGPEALLEYRQSHLRASIAEAYEVEGEPRVEVYRIFKTLRED